MSFGQMMEILQRKNKGKIVICNAGEFYLAVGKDAVLLNELLGLKTVCLKPEICKVGFPITSLEKYTDLLQEKDYSYIVYYLDKQKTELEVILDYDGKKTNKLEYENRNCYICSKGTSKYKKPNQYIQALAKLYEKEEKENEDKRRKNE